MRQVLADEQDGVRGLAGAMGSVVSRDGKFVYTTSGRFAGDNAVGVYQVGADGKLTVLQEFINEQSDIKDFTGGNQLTLSPDETRLYASATTSCSLACFRRDPVSGKLTYMASIRSEATGAGTGLGANGVQCSKDGRFLYLALEELGAVTVFERSQPAQP
jgi:sugar lactone lactonase YvrE